MNRKDFLSLLGISAAGLVIPTCLGACQADKSTPANAPTADLSLDLNSSKYASLKTQGNFVQHDSGIVVAYGTDGKYYAVQAVCPHEGGVIKYDKTNNNFPCTKHPENIFSNSGVSNGRQTKSNLKAYTCTLNGTTLTIKS